jgi:hypothetical protein
MKVIDRFITRRIELITLFSILTFTFDCNYESVQFKSRTQEGSEINVYSR